MVTLKEIATNIYRGSGIKRNQVTEGGIDASAIAKSILPTTRFKCISHTQLEYYRTQSFLTVILFAYWRNVEDILSRCGCLA